MVFEAVSMCFVVERGFDKCLDIKYYFFTCKQKFILFGLLINYLNRISF